MCSKCKMWKNETQSAKQRFEQFEDHIGRWGKLRHVWSCLLPGNGSAQRLQVLHTKTVAEIWDSKTPSVGTILACRSYFFRNKTFLFFKIERWNFQHLFEKKNPETSQNFNSCSIFRQFLLPIYLLVVSK